MPHVWFWSLSNRSERQCGCDAQNRELADKVVSQRPAYMAGTLSGVGGDFTGTCRVAESKTGGFAWIRKTTSLLSSPQVPALLRHFFACGQPKRCELKTRYGEKEPLNLTCVAMPLRRLCLGTNPLKSLLTWAISGAQRHPGQTHSMAKRTPRG